LFLFVPAGLSPRQGFAPNIGAAYARTIPLPHLSFSPDAFTRISLALQAGMWAAFVSAISLLSRLADSPGQRAAFKLVVAGSPAAGAALILPPPPLTADIYQYALYGRMILTRGLNPYVTPGGVLADDPLWALAGWHDFPTHLGPLFTGLSLL